MSRTRSVTSAVDRRALLAAVGAVGASAGLGLALGPGSGSAVAAPPATGRPAVGRAVRAEPGAPTAPAAS
ncbi:TIGR03767 family metallophosphoesterase, partial [Streptomyces sp. NPDC002055]